MQSKVRYQALGPLMSGEGSRAFLGLEISEEDRARPVVLVWVPEVTAEDSARVAQLHKETMRAAALQHPNIIRVHGLVALEEGLARVVEFADGETLRRVLDVAGTLPPRFAAFVAAEVAMGVHFAHLTGSEDGTPLIHGDLRPETVLVSFSGVCKVSGYGALSVAPREMGGKRVMGRRKHCAPEQVLGGRDNTVRETDVYLLGILLYECLTGLIPFGEEKDFDQAVVGQPLKLENQDAIPAGLVGVLAKACAKRASERFPTALAFREALERAMGGLPTGEEFAAWLKPYFPEADAVRAARRRELDAGIADLARKQWEEGGRAGPPPAPPSPPAQETVAPPRPAPPAHAAVRPAVPARQAPVPAAAPAVPTPPAPAPAPASPGSMRWQPLIVGASLVVAVLGVLFGVQQSRKHAANEPPPPGERVAQLAPASPPPAPATAPASPPRPAPVEARAEPPPAPAPPPEPVKPPPEPPSLELTVTPPVDVTIDGQDVGRSPVSMPLAAGRHSLGLKDSSKGINVSRSVTVGREGKTRHRIVLEKASVTVSAPAGATVLMDGRVVGKAPVGEISVYEGRHRIMVTMGQAKWQQPFSVEGGHTMTFNVQQTAGP